MSHSHHHHHPKGASLSGPTMSLLRLSAGHRVVMASGLAACLWLAVWAVIG